MSLFDSFMDTSVLFEDARLGVYEVDTPKCSCGGAIVYFGRDPLWDMYRFGCYRCGRDFLYHSSKLNPTVIVAPREIGLNLDCCQ